MNQIKKRDKTTPILILEDHELRLRYIETYIREVYIDCATMDKSFSIDKKMDSMIMTTKKVTEQVTPISILEDHELRLRQIETYITNKRKQVIKEEPHPTFETDKLSSSSSSLIIPNDAKKEITIILTRLGDLLKQLR